MKKYPFLAAILIWGFACSPDNKTDLMVVEGRVEGLKKGTLYLQHVADSTLQSVDSIQMRGDGAFRLQATVSEPDLYYLYLDNADNNRLDDRISFFGEPGNYRIQTSWNGFEKDAEIKGPSSQEAYQTFRETMSRFRLEELAVLKAMAGLEMPGDSSRIDSLENALDRNLKRRYRYALNFAFSHKDSHLAPFIASTEVADANPKYLDSVYRVLPPQIAESKYGKKLKGLLD
jgi:hypothetical protein